MPIVRGLAEVQRTIQRIASDLENTIQSDVLMEAAKKFVVPAIRDRAPVRTGKLRDSITAQLAKSRSGKPIVKVGPGKGHFYSKFIEFGTSKVSARPFLRPAFRSVRKEVNKFLKSQIGRAIRSRVRGKFKKKAA